MKLSTMFRNRIHGLVALHGIVLAVVLCAAYLGSISILHGTGMVELSETFNTRLYFCGVLVSGLSIYRHFRRTASSYGRLSLSEALGFTSNQLMRLMLVMFTIAFVTKDAHVSRSFLLLFIVASGGVLLAANLVLPRVLAFIFVRDSVYRTVLAVANNESLQVRPCLSRYAGLGIDIVGYVAQMPLSGNHGLLWLGTPAGIATIVPREGVQQLLIDHVMLKTPEGPGLVEQCERLGCRVRSYCHLGALLPSPSASFESYGDYGFGTITPEPLDNALNRMAKRLLDIAVALPVVLFVLPPVILATAIAQWRQSPGPVLHFQWRSGLNGHRFLIYKIRTMHLTTSMPATRQATRSDDRIYPFGRFLRRTSMDELPQFLNVLRGEMSVSGPRPHLLEHDELFATAVGTYRKRHFVKPGITGLAQANGYRGETAGMGAISERVRYDIHYIENWSLLLDIRIIISTARQVFFPPSSAY